MQTGKREICLQKIEELRIWVDYLKGNTMCRSKDATCRSKDADVEDIIGWVDSATKNPVPSQTLAKWVRDVLNM